jgi:hypothetical protein
MNSDIRNKPSLAPKAPKGPEKPEGNKKIGHTSKWNGMSISDKVQFWMNRIAEISMNIMHRLGELTNNQSEKVKLSKTEPNLKNKKATAKSNEAAQKIKPNSVLPVSIAIAKPAIADCRSNLISLIDNSKYAKIKEIYPDIYNIVNKQLSENEEGYDKDVQKLKEYTWEDALILFITDKVIEMSSNYPKRDPSDGTSFQEFLYKDSLNFPKYEDIVSVMKEFIELKITKIQEKSNPALQNDLTKLGTNPTFQKANEFVQNYEKQHGRIQLMTPKK